MRRRWLLAGIVLVGLLESVGWFLGASLLWAFHDLFVGAGSIQAAANGRFAIAVYAASGINVIALIAFVLGRRGWAWWSLTTVQVGDLAFSVVEAVVRSTTWWLFAAVAVLMLALLLLLRRAP